MQERLQIQSKNFRGAVIERMKAMSITTGVLRFDSMLQQRMHYTPVKATGWMANQLIALHMLPIAIAAWPCG